MSGPDDGGVAVWTPEEMREFDQLSWRASSPNQVERISGRLDMSAFVKAHGKFKCDAMWKALLDGGEA